MAVLSSRARGTPIRVVLAFIVMVASVPTFYGVVASGTRCSITLDICHPVQSVNSSAAPLMGPPPTAASNSEAPLQLHESIAASAPFEASRPADAPDPHPPKPAS